MLTVLRQSLASAESRAVSAECLTGDITSRALDLDQLQYVEQLRASPRQVLPVGSVEFLREAMRVAGITEPDNFSYPGPLIPLLRREVESRRAGSVLGHWFIKPKQTKAFTGFVYDTMRSPEAYDEHDREQYEAFMELDADVPVWVAEPVQFLSEWRYYVHRGEVLGSARYDPHGEDDAPRPDQAVLEDALQRMQPVGLAAFALDLGVLSTGETALVEVNDAWALGYYAGGDLHRGDYLKMLMARWDQIVGQAADPVLLSAGPETKEGTAP
jgi:hypothetical protein